LVTEPGFVEHDYTLLHESHIEADLETAGEVGDIWRCPNYDIYCQTRTSRVIPLVVLGPA
jgi:hypothetical protein